MKLPNDTIIAEAKITQYLLKFLVEDDQSLFLARANYTQANWQQLDQDLKEQILPLDATPTEQTRYGNKYEIRGILTGPNGISLRVVTIWMTEFPSQKTKFITLYSSPKSVAKSIEGRILTVRASCSRTISKSFRIAISQ